MTHPKRRRRELLRNLGVHRRVIARIGAKRLPDQHGEVFAVDDVLVFRRRNGLGHVVELLTRPRRILRGEPPHQIVMFAHKQGRGRGELRVFHDACVTGDEHIVYYHQRLTVVRTFERSVRVTQACRHRGAGPVKLRKIKKSGDGVDDRVRRWVPEISVQRNRCSIWECRVSGWNDDIDRPRHGRRRLK